MKPTEILSTEHRVIEIVLDCLKRLVERSKRNGRLEKDFALQAVDIIRNFADKCHHGKEEKHLFTALVEKGVPNEGGPVGQMLHEHEVGRKLVRGMVENIEASAAGDVQALERFGQSAVDYIILLRSHIQKEDRVLFPVADRMLDNNDQSRLLKAFDNEESEHMGAGTHDRYLKMVFGLADALGVDYDKTLDGSCHCGH